MPSFGASFELKLYNPITGQFLVAASINICPVSNAGLAERQITPPLMCPLSRHLVNALIPSTIRRFLTSQSSSDCGHFTLLAEAL